MVRATRVVDDGRDGMTETPAGLGADDEDGRLVARLAAGDRDALVALYERYQRPLFGYLLRLTDDRGLAEEVLQDTLLALWRGAGRFAGRSGARTWIFGIAHRQAHNALRRRGVPRADAEASAGPEDVPDAGPGPEDYALAGAARADLIRALSRLSPAHRAVLSLTLVQGLPQQDVADVLGVPLGTIKSRLHTAKAALRLALTQQEEDDA